MPPSKAQRAKTAERREKAIALRLAGATWEQIAQALKYAGKAAAYVDVQRALRQRIEAQHERADELLMLELMRLDRLQQGLWAQAIGGDPKAADAVLRVIDRRIRLLGLDGPQHMDEQTRRELTLRVAEQMQVVLARVLDSLGLSEEQRALVPELIREAVAALAASGSLRQIDGEVVG